MIQGTGSGKWFVPKKFALHSYKIQLQLQDARRLLISWRPWILNPMVLMY